MLLLAFSAALRQHLCASNPIWWSHCASSENAQSHNKGGWQAPSRRLQALKPKELSQCGSCICKGMKGVRLRHQCTNTRSATTGNAHTRGQGLKTSVPQKRPQFMMQGDS